MNFLVTTYVYPVAQPIELSKYLKIQLDNPRTDDEIKAVKDYLFRACESGQDYALPIHSNDDIVTVESVLLRFRDSFSDADSHLRERFEAYNRDEALKFLASVWVVARYEDEGESKRLQEFHMRMRSEGHITFSLLDDEHPIVKGETTVSDYSYLLSLLINSERDSYYGRGFVISSPEPTTVQDKSMWFQLLLIGLMSDPESRSRKCFENDSLRWVFFPLVRNELQTKSKLLESAFEIGLADKFLYIGSLLRIVAESGDDKVKLVILTSILELLLTHNPDYKRFNVEESISKQFQLKGALLVYLNDRSQNLDSIGKRLRVIYDQRSNIAHGNFEAMTRYIKNLSKGEGKEEYFSDLITDLYSYIRAVLEEYMKDIQLVEFLKAL